MNNKFEIYKKFSQGGRKGEHTLHSIFKKCLIYCLGKLFLPTDKVIQRGALLIKNHDG